MITVARAASRSRGGKLTASFDDNACVLLNNKGEMLGTRVTGVVAAELAKATGSDGNGRWSKILSLAPKVSDSCHGASIGS